MLPTPTYAYRDPAPDAEIPEAPRRPGSFEKSYRRGLHGGLALAARLVAEADTPADALVAVTRALNVAAEFRDSGEYVPGLADEIARRVRQR